MKAILNKFSSFFLQGGLKETVLRFPVSSFCAFALFVLSVLATHNVLDREELLFRTAVSLVVGYFWFGGMRLVAESLAWTRGKEMLMAFLPYVPFVMLMAWAEDFGLYLLFIVPALLLFLMVAPYTKSKLDNHDDLSFWLFNRYLWAGVLLSFLAIMIMTGGLHAAFASIEALFGLDMPHEVMGDIWAFSSLVVGPIYALSFVPKSFTYEDRAECEQTPGLMFMLNWILAPLILIYFLILYAYFIKLLVIQELPLGVLAYMVTGFAGVGIAMYLVGWPVRDQAGALVQKFYKYFFPALIIPVALQFLAIGERIYTFGVTEQRYMVALSAVWLTILVALFTFRKATSIKVMPGLLAVLLVLAAFGPWGAVGLSSMSQYNRLEQLLVKHDILQDGKVVKTKAEIPYEDRKSISSKVEYFYTTDRKERLRHWFPDVSDKEWDSKYAGGMVQKMGFQFISKYDIRHNTEERFQFYSHTQRRTGIDVRGYDYIATNIYAIPRKNDRGIEHDNIAANPDTGQPKISWRLSEQSILTVIIEGGGEVALDVGAFVKAKGSSQSSQTPKNMTLEGVAPGIKVRVMFTNLSGKMENGSPKVENASFTILLDL